MKKIAIILAATGLAFASFGAQADGGQLVQGDAVAFAHPDNDDAPAEAVDCSALNRREVVNVNSSNNVHGHVFCGTGPVYIGVATCHESGRQNADDTFNYFFASSVGGRVAAVEREAGCVAEVDDLATLAEEGPGS